jgi:uncharacterized membrane protein YuzA (DUF378 family)
MNSTSKFYEHNQDHAGRHDPAEANIFGDRMEGDFRHWPKVLPTASNDHSAAEIARADRLPQAAAPDFPAAIGWGLIGIYAAVMLDFVLFFTASRMAALMVGVSVVYVIVYLATPVFFMRIERRGTGYARHEQRVSLRDFMARGVETWTGRVGGRDAIAQLFTIPAVLVVALCAIGIAWQAVR